MSTDLFRIEVERVEPTALEVKLTILDRDSGSLPKTAPWALMMLAESARTHIDSEDAAARGRRAASEIGRTVSIDQACSEAFLADAAPRFITQVRQTETKPDRWGRYRIEVTDARWIAHLAVGMRWGSTSYDPYPRSPATPDPAAEPAAPAPAVTAAQRDQLVEQLRGTPSLAVLRDAIRADLLDDLTEADRDRLATIVFAAFHADDLRDHYHAGAILSSLQRAAAAYTYVTDALAANPTDANLVAALRAYGVLALSHDYDKPLKKAVAKHLDDKRIEVRAAALAAVWGLERSDAEWKRIVAGVKSPDEAIRIAALWAASGARKRRDEARALLTTAAADPRASSRQREVVELALRFTQRDP